MNDNVTIEFPGKPPIHTTTDAIKAAADRAEQRSHGRKRPGKEFEPKRQEEAPATRFAKDQLKAFVERIERLNEEKKEISDDIGAVFAEAKSSGFDVKALRAIIRRRKQDPNALAEHETILETYMQALGML